MPEPNLDLLLAKGARSGRQRDATLDRILDRVTPRRRASGRRWLLAASTATAIAAAWLLVAGVKPHGAGGAFAARGTSAAEPRVELVCAGGKLEACPSGSRLLFVVSGGTRPGYLAAYAEPVGGGRERVWYFPGERDAHVIAAGAAQAAPLDTAVQIGPEHGVGPYVVHVVVGSRPFSREEALRPATTDTLFSKTIALEIVP
jgi:hypothetical protein